jgi:hypothetical protein
MTQTIKPFNLRALILSPDTAQPPGENLPTEVAGQPASYFWKDLIHAGAYVHPETKVPLDVNGARLNRWAETGRQMLSSGVAIPINCDHSDAARDVVGYVKEFKVDGDRLLALCQFIGEDAALLAARNLVSVGIDPDFTDGEARKWGEAIVHLALTPVPVVPDQDQFGEAEELPAQPESQGADDPGDSGEGGGQAPSEDAGAEKLKMELASPKQEILRLSTRLPRELPAEARSAIAESAAAKFDLAVERGVLSPAARERLVEALVGDKHDPPLITLSRAGNAEGGRCLALAVADILLDNTPLVLGEATGLQALPRHIPGDESAGGIEQLCDYMTRVASVGR